MATVDNVGILQLRLYHMESIKKFPRGISDQVISETTATANGERAPDSAKELGEVQPWDREATPSSKFQAPSCKLQAASLTRKNYSVIGLYGRKKYESKRSKKNN